MAYSFRGGVHPDDMKKYTAAKPIEDMPQPKTVVLPVSMHIGAPSKPTVSVGDYVKLGQVVCDTESPVSSPVHASVSGTVTAIEPREHPLGSKVLSVVIENDGEDRVIENLRPYDKAAASGETDISALARSYGIVGLGGAAFPTHIKLKSAIGKVDTLIINGCECEPYITADHRLLLENTEELISGIHTLAEYLGLKSATLAVESNKETAIEHMKKILKGSHTINLRVLRTKYPQGSEKQVIETITGREMPPGKLPADVGCVVVSVATTVALAHSMATGMPLISKVVSVSGSAIGNAKNLRVRIGTPIEELFAYVGGFREDPYKIIMGGPMMGNALHTLSVPVVKATNAVLAFSRKEDREAKDPVCIRCGKCVMSCPMHLLPLNFNMYVDKAMYDECVKINVRDCIECGCCSYICPARLPLVQKIRLAKQLSGPAGK